MKNNSDQLMLDRLDYLCSLEKNDYKIIILWRGNKKHAAKNVEGKDFRDMSGS